jgi:hypothetical protein
MDDISTGIPVVPSNPPAQDGGAPGGNAADDLEARLRDLKNM